MTTTANVIPASGKRARSKAANRRAILDAGRRVFARIGFEATTVRDIIREKINSSLNKLVITKISKNANAHIGHVKTSAPYTRPMTH